MECNYRTSIQIRFGDIDLMGHVNNAVQLSYFDLARFGYFKMIYGDVIDWHESALIVAHLELDYLSPIYLDDKIEVLTRIVRLGNKSIGMEQWIVDEKTGEVKTKSSQVMVGYSQKLSQSIPIPEVLKIRVQEFEGKVLV